MHRAERLIPEIAVAALRALAKQDLAALAAVAACALRGRDDVLRHWHDRRRPRLTIPIRPRARPRQPMRPACPRGLRETERPQPRAGGAGARPWRAIRRRARSGATGPWNRGTRT